MNKIKLLGVMILFLVGVAAISVFASAALPVSNVQVEVEDRNVYGGSVTIPGLDKDNEIEVEVSFTANQDIEEVEIEAEIKSTGHKDSVSDTITGFDVHSGANYLKTLTLSLPQRMENLRNYDLLVTITGRINSTHTDYVVVNGDIDISSKQHQIQIKDVVLNPEEEVQAGRSLLTTIRVKNRGEGKEEDVKVKVSIPALGISASDYIDEIDAEGGDDDSTTSEELYLRIPEDAVSGEYTVKTEVTYDDGDEKETATATISIAGAEAAATPASAPRTIIAVPELVQDVAKEGSAVVYPITITNSGSASRTYTITVDGANWADFAISPSNVVVIGAAESKAVYVAVAAKESATAGENTFAVTIKSDDTVLKEIPLKVNVLESAKSGVSLKKALEISLVILVVLIVIIGLIVGLGKLKGKEDETQEEKETYY